VKPNGTCRSCGAPIVWVITANGKQMPLDPEPADDGNVWVTGVWAGRRTVAVGLTGADVPRNEALRYVSHFVTCKDAATWRKR
jgi:hypothetical protein